MLQLCHLLLLKIMINKVKRENYNSDEEYQKDYERMVQLIKDHDKQIQLKGHPCMMPDIELQRFYKTVKENFFRKPRIISNEEIEDNEQLENEIKTILKQ